MTTSQVTDDLGLQTSTTTGNNTTCEECYENNIVSQDLIQSICSTCSDVCPLTHVMFCLLCSSNPSECSTITAPHIITTFPSWRLNWCPRRIGGNPNRHFFLVAILCVQQRNYISGWGDSPNAASILGPKDPVETCGDVFPSTRDKEDESDWNNPITHGKQMCLGSMLRLNVHTFDNLGSFTSRYCRQQIL